jgi:hypothetical protein
MVDRKYRGDILPIERNLDTGTWDWAIPGMFANIPGQIESAASANPARAPITDEQLGSALGLAGFGVTPFRGGSPRGVSLASAPVPGAAPMGPRLATPKPGGVLASLPTQPGPYMPDPFRSNVRTRGLGGAIRNEIPEEGFFMGPWANPENMPGVTLASRPQPVWETFHGTNTDEMFDMPRTESFVDEALHNTVDPVLATGYTDARKMDPWIDETFGDDIGGSPEPLRPRIYPMLTNPGPNVADIGPLVGFYPWRKDLDTMMPGPMGSAENMDTLLEHYNAGYMNPQYLDAMLARDQGQSFRDYMKEKGYSAMAYEHEPTNSMTPHHPSFAITDPGQTINPLTSEGILAKQWNDVIPMESSMTPELERITIAQRAMEAMDYEPNPYDTNRFTELLRDRYRASEEDIKAILDMVTLQ